MIKVALPTEFVSMALRSADEDLDSLPADVSTLIERGTSDVTIVQKMVEAGWPVEFATWYVESARKHHPEKIVLVLSPAAVQTDLVTQLVPGDTRLAKQANLELESRKKLEREKRIGLIWLWTGGLLSIIGLISSANAGRPPRFSLAWIAVYYGFRKCMDVDRRLRR